MGYKFSIDQYYKIKKEAEYPWPCTDEPNRKITLFTDDVLTKSDDGTYTKHTGLCCCNIQLKDNEVEFIDDPVHLYLI